MIDEKNAARATDPNDLERRILDPNIAKTEAEWLAKRRIEQLEADAARLNWIDKALFQHQWNGVVDEGGKTYWRLAGDYRHTVTKMEGETFREAIDAMKEPE